MKRLLRAALLLAATVTCAAAHPYTISCPIDGQAMGFDHQIGSGQEAVCWYSHRMAAADGSGKIETHQAYVPCGD